MDTHPSPPILTPRMDAFVKAPAFMFDPHSMFDLSLDTAETELMTMNSGFVWFNCTSSQMSANIVIDEAASAIRISDLRNADDRYSNNRLNRLVDMVERVAHAKQMHMVFVSTKIDEIGYLTMEQSFTPTKKSAIVWPDDKVNEMLSLYDRWKTLKWQMDKFVLEHMQDMQLVKTTAGPVTTALQPFSDESPLRDNPLFDDFD